MTVETGSVSAEVLKNASELFLSDDESITAIDLPIGLPSNESRKCDIEARRRLGPRGSSVFPSRVRLSLEAVNYTAACLASYESCGKRLSKQAFALVPRIREVDEILRTRSSLRDSVYEVHPEVSFYYWNGGRPMQHPKRSGLGFTERYHLVTSEFGGTFERIRAAIPRSAAADDDILDAFAALWTAMRIRSGNAVRIPQTLELDAVGLPMRMLA